MYASINLIFHEFCSEKLNLSVENISDPLDNEYEELGTFNAHV